LPTSRRRISPWSSSALEDADLALEPELVLLAMRYNAAGAMAPSDGMRTPRTLPSGVPIAQRGPGWSYRVDPRPPSLYRRHQPGIETPRLDHAELAAFDLRARARDVLVAWTLEAERLLGDGLTITFGLGAGAFTDALRPVALRALPQFPGDLLDPARSGCDIAVQVCATRAGDARAALERLRSAAAGAVVPRWNQGGSLRRRPQDDPNGTPRDALGFRDGTHNLRRGRDLDRHVWVSRGDRTGMIGGTYLVVRRIEIATDAWNELSLDAQERLIGRERDSGAPLGGRREFEPAPLEAFPASSHVRLAAPRTNGGAAMLRRSYSFDRGLLFLAFMRDPARQFVPVNRRLVAHDALMTYTRHTASAVFAIPPGARPGGFVGDGLLGER
jgi:deferrochelatase/peroxidase EfeB